METQKIKRYRLSVSRVFPKGHPNAGQKTYFVEKINVSLAIKEGTCEFCSLKGKMCKLCANGNVWAKHHTCRGNYGLWAKRIDEVREGKAVIELFYWDGKPYGKGVKQVVFATLDKDSGCGVQKISSVTGWLVDLQLDDGKNMPFVDLKTLAKNDGLFVEDFAAWFKGTDLSKPMAIIQFTDFRY